jgi:hypothetical protein
MSGDNVCAIDFTATNYQYLKCFPKSTGLVTTPVRSRYTSIDVGPTVSCAVDDSFIPYCGVIGTDTWKPYSGYMESISTDDGIILGIDINLGLYYMSDTLWEQDTFVCFECMTGGYSPEKVGTLTTVSNIFAQPVNHLSLSRGNLFGFNF